MAAAFFQLAWRRVVRCLIFFCALPGAFPEGKGAEANGDAFLPIFQPFEAEAAALSPDGRYFAVSRREQSGASVYIMQIDGAKVVRVRLGEDRKNITLNRDVLQVDGLHWSGDWLVAELENYPQTMLVTMKADGTGLRSIIDLQEPEWTELGLKKPLPPVVTLVRPQPHDPRVIPTNGVR